MTELCPACGQPVPPLKIFIDRGTKTVFHEGVTCKLTPKEVDLLAHIVKDYPKIVSKNDLMATYWKLEDVSPITVNVTIDHLRKKMKAAKLGFRVKTVWGRGYTVEKL